MKIITILSILFISKNIYANTHESSFEAELKMLENGEIEKEERLLKNVEAVNLLNEMEKTTDEITDDAVSVNMSAIKRQPVILEEESLPVDNNYNLIVPQKKLRIRSR